MLKELLGFIRRNGIRPAISYALEIYIGGALRLLPGIEGFFLRSVFYRTLFRGSGKNLFIYPHVTIIFSHRITTGSRVAVNTGTYIDARGGLSIGDNVMIGPNCVLSTCDHGTERTDIPMCRQPIVYGRITIGNDVWLGANVFVRNGVTVGEGSVLAAGAVVASDVPPYCVFGGVPGKVLSYRKKAA